MPDVILPVAFVALLAQFRPVFTKPSFDNFVVLIAGFVHALGKHRVTDALRAAGRSATKHYGTYYRFFSRAQWSLDEFGLALLGLVIRLFPRVKVELVLDDSLMRRTGKKVALATMHADPLLKQGGRPFMSYGHVFVILSVHITVPLLGRTGWALPFMFRLYESSRQGGRADSPSDQRRAFGRRRLDKGVRSRLRLTDREVVEGHLAPCSPKPDSGPLPSSVRPTKLQLACEMILRVARRFPRVRFRVLADHLYCGNGVLHGVQSQVDNVTFIVRGHPNAALYDLPPVRKPGQRGRPRVRGDRLPTPESWATAHPGRFVTTTVDIYGKEVPVRLGSYCGMAYRSLPDRLVRYVVTKDPDGVYKDDYLLSTDPDETPQEIVVCYSHRWPLERAIQDTKQKLGIQDPEVQRPESVRRIVPMLMMLYSLVVLWFVQLDHADAARLGRPLDAWYPTRGRPSFTEMLAVIRRASWAEPIVDPPLEHLPREEIMADYLARVVAAA